MRFHNQTRLCEVCDGLPLGEIFYPREDRDLARIPAVTNPSFWITCQYCSLCSLFLKALQEDHRYASICGHLRNGWVLILTFSTNPGFYKPSGWSRCIVRRQIEVQLYWNYEPARDYVHLPLFAPGIQLLADEEKLDWEKILKGNTARESVDLALQHFGLGRRFDMSLINVEMIKRWLHVCDRDHRTAGSLENCNDMEIGSSNDFSSMRFIDIQRGCVVQWASSGLPVYLALSYVWGSPDEVSHLKLTTDTSVWLQTPGSLSDGHIQIPHTIFDAMVLTKRLGQRYLWVDALCIQQDDPLDKMAQIPLMATIYSQAFCTIVAGAGKDAWAGLQGIDRPRSGRQHVAHVKGFNLVTYRQHFPNWLLNSVWETRGWTLQEKVCSRRMLIFTESQAFFLCKSSLLYEDTNLESQAMNLGSSASRQNLLNMDYFSSVMTAYGSFAIDLCKRSFGLDSDILLAFKGIEQWLKSRSNDTDQRIDYFHWGVPETIFDTVICWSFPMHDPTWRRGCDSFPSWCWAGWKLHPGPAFGKAPSIVMPTGVLIEYRCAWFVFAEDGKLRRLRTLPGRRFVVEGLSEIVEDEVALQDIPKIPKDIPDSHLVFFWTTESLLTVDRNGCEYSYRQINDPSLQNSTFTVRNPFTGDEIGEVTLHRDWRSRQPDRLSFIALLKVRDKNPEREHPENGWFVMLVEWIDGIAHRVQTLKTPIEGDIWEKTRPERRLVSLA